MTASGVVSSVFRLSVDVRLLGSIGGSSRVMYSTGMSGMTILVFDTRPLARAGVRPGEDPSVDEDLEDDVDRSGSGTTIIGSGSITTVGSLSGSGGGVSFKTEGNFFGVFLGGGATAGAFLAGGGTRSVRGLVLALSRLNEVGTTASGFASSSMDNGVLMKSNWSKKSNCVALFLGEICTCDCSVQSADA